MEIPLELYRVFAAVAEHQSVSRAAASLFITQPAVSQSIKQLESRLGGTLFTRTPRGVTLTREGEALYAHVKEGLGQLRAGESRLRAILAMESGHIHIGAGDSMCKHFLLPFLGKFHALYPEIEIHVTNRTSPETLRLVQSGQVDIGFVNLPAEGKGLEVESCAPIQDCFVAGEPFFHLTHEPMSLRALAEQPLLLLERDSITRLHLDSWAAERGVSFHPAIELGSHDLLVEFARIGLGVAAVVEEYVAQELAQGLLRKVNLDVPPPQRAIGAVFSQTALLSSAAAAFRQLVREG